MTDEAGMPKQYNGDRISCRLVRACLEIRSDEIAYYNIEQDNYCLLEIQGVPDGCGIKIAAEWGAEPYHLTTRNRAREIVCQTGYGWKAAFVEHETELYWMLTRTEAVKRYDPILYVRLSNLIVYNEGMARLKLNFTADEQEGPASYIQLEKRPCSLRIDSFEPEEGTVNPPRQPGENNAVLNWCVSGARRCVLNPGNIEVPPVGSMAVSVMKNCIFSLSAFNQNISVEKTTMIYTYGTVSHDLFNVIPHKYYMGCPTAVHWKLQGEVSDIQLWSGGKQLRKDLSPEGSLMEGELQEESDAPEYILSFQRAGESVELCYEREPDERESVILLRISYDEPHDAFHIRWETFKAKRAELLVFYRKKSDSAGEEKQFVNRHELIKISSERRGDERWSLEHDRNFSVHFLLRAVNAYGEEIEKHVECRA